MTQKKQEIIGPPGADMMVNQPVKCADGIYRFPRIANAKFVGDMVRKMWISPVFTVRQTAKATEFVHSIPFQIPNRMKRLNHGTYSMLFEAQRVDIKATLQTAYKRSKYKRKVVHDLVDRLFRRVFQDAMEDIFENAKTSPYKYAASIKGDRATFAKHARPRRSGTTDRGPLAVRFAERYDEIYPEVVRLYKFVEGFKQRWNPIELKKAVENNFKADWIRCVIDGDAFRLVPNVPNHCRDRLPNRSIAGFKGGLTALGKLDWTARQLTAGILASEKINSLAGLAAATILDKYIPLGRKTIRRKQYPRTSSSRP
jgi:hypothetical protein